MQSKIKITKLFKNSLQNYAYFGQDIHLLEVANVENSNSNGGTFFMK